jgi:hypothetical protein
MRRSLLIALLLSGLLHLVVLAAPDWRVDKWFAADESPSGERLEARLLARKTSLAKNPTPRKVAASRPVPPILDAVKPSFPEPSADAGDEVPAAADTEDLADHETPAVEDKAPVQEPEKAVTAEPEPVAVPEIAPLLPSNGRIRYSVTRGDGGFIVGQSIHEWQHDGKHYTLRATSETTGIAAIFKPVKVVQTSEGGFLKGELKPESFRYDRGEKGIATASFDWEAQQVTLGDGQVISISDGAEDILSMFYQLMQAAQRGEGFVMAVATGRKVERYAFEWLGEETLSLKAGSFRTWHVRVRAAVEGKDVTDIWLGREVAGLPVKIRFTDRKGEVSEQVAEEIHYEGK